MDTARKEIHFRKAELADLAELEEIRRLAFAPIFSSFRSILGEDLYLLAQEAEDRTQGNMLLAALKPEDEWQMYVAEREQTSVGFIQIKLDRQTLIGEIGLNAVHPDYANQGIGTQMYAFAAQLMKDSGMKVATVSTGGDPSHAAARKAYEKAGFTHQIPSVWYCKKL